jgi:hypothetical protein
VELQESANNQQKQQKQSKKIDIQHILDIQSNTKEILRVKSLNKMAYWRHLETKLWSAWMAQVLDSMQKKNKVLWLFLNVILRHTNG